MTLREHRPIRALAGIGAGIVWLAFASSSLAEKPAAIDWRTDLRGARGEAHAMGRPLLIQFTGSWCPNCVRMEQETLANPRVAGLARDRFIPIRLASDLHEDLVLAARLTGIPATVIVKPSGEVIAKHEGFVDAATFSTFLESSLGRIKPLRRQAGSALGGYCPVTLVATRRLVPGRDDVTLMHEGRLYRFAGLRQRIAFQEHPERYIPVNGGRCPVSQVDQSESRPGDPRWGVLYAGHLYLCKDEPSRRHFLKDPRRYLLSGPEPLQAVRADPRVGTARR